MSDGTACLSPNWNVRLVASSDSTARGIEGHAQINYKFRFANYKLDLCIGQSLLLGWGIAMLRISVLFLGGSLYSGLVSAFYDIV